MSRRRWIVRGRVQGVGFRAGVADAARRLGLDARARNLADGSLECEAAGPDAALDALAVWLQRGPALARVDSVEVVPA